MIRYCHAVCGKQPHLKVDVTERDEMEWVTVASVAGLLAAALLVLIGGFPLDMPMPEHEFGWVAPSCGLTRGSTAIARGDWAIAWRYNPASFVVMAFGALGVVRLLVGGLAGKWLNIRWKPGRLAAVLGIALVVAWTLYQQTNAEFIINSRA